MSNPKAIRSRSSFEVIFIAVFSLVLFICLLFAVFKKSASSLNDLNQATSQFSTCNFYTNKHDYLDVPADNIKTMDARNSVIEFTVNGEFIRSTSFTMACKIEDAGN